jgi:hypothetical protein
MISPRKFTIDVASNPLKVDAFEKWLLVVWRKKSHAPTPGVPYRNYPISKSGGFGMPLQVGSNCVWILRHFAAEAGFKRKDNHVHASFSYVSNFEMWHISPSE